MDKREQIERALRQRAMDIAFKEPRKYDNELISVHWMDAGVHEGINAIIDALADQAIVIECEVGHHETPEAGKWTNIYYAEMGRLVATISSGEHVGIRGKAILIILSLEEENNGETC